MRTSGRWRLIVVALWVAGLLAVGTAGSALASPARTTFFFPPIPTPTPPPHPAPLNLANPVRTFVSPAVTTISLSGSATVTFTFSPNTFDRCPPPAKPCGLPPVRYVTAIGKLAITIDGVPQPYPRLDGYHDWFFANYPVPYTVKGSTLGVGTHIISGTFNSNIYLAVSSPIPAVATIIVTP